MKMIPRRPLYVLLAFAFLTSLILAQKPNPSAQTKRESGLTVTTFETRLGAIRVSLSDDMAAGDTISGTVMTEPAGKNDKDRQKNAAELNAGDRPTPCCNRPNHCNTSYRFTAKRDA